MLLYSLLQSMNTTHGKKMKYLVAWFMFLTVDANATESICYGTTSNGYLEDGVKLPAGGRNFEGYSTIARMAGRTYVHSEVRNIIVSAYQRLEIEQPNRVYKYAETGFKKGGEFRPHKTHRNGLSVDFMAPVVNEQGKSVHLPTTVLNRFGYSIEFNDHSEYKGLRIDYEALAAHIVSLDREARKRGHRLWRVIFAPELQPGLFKTRYAEYLRNNIEFSRKRSWVRHDEHYHVDFDIPCKK